MKKFIVSLCLLALSVFAFSNEYALMHKGDWESRTIYRGRVVSLEIWRFQAPNTVEFRQFISSDTLKTGTYIISYVQGVPYLTFHWETGASQRYLMLFNGNFMILYSGADTAPAWFLRNIPESFDPGASFDRMQSITASSTLTEGNIQHSATPERLGWSINQGWAVEGGVGERLSIRLNVQNAGAIFISSGYIDYSRPYLFREYSRPKRIRITTHMPGGFLIDEQSFEVELQDTPNYQRIQLWRDFSRGWGGNMQVEIEILQTFPGTRSNTMFINSILGIMTQ
jgi:hypothetical protein